MSEYPDLDYPDFDDYWIRDIDESEWDVLMYPLVNATDEQIEKSFMETLNAKVESK